MPILNQFGQGGEHEAVRLSDLPEGARRAHTLKAVSALDLDPGSYGEEAHAVLIAAAAGMQEEAERKAGISRFMRAGFKAGLGRKAVHQAVWDAFGNEGNSASSLDRWEAQASSMVLDIELGTSENSPSTAELHRRAFKRFGASDNELTDNGTAFSSHSNAGQVKHKFRNKGTRRPDLEPPGVFKHLGFNLHSALPENGRAKRVGRSFADMSRQIGTGREFKGAHAGCKPGERPDGRILPVPYDLFIRVHRAKVDAYNALTGRKSQGCPASKTSSYVEAFNALSQGNRNSDAKAAERESAKCP